MGQTIVYCNGCGRRMSESEVPDHARKAGHAVCKHCASTYIGPDITAAAPPATSRAAKKPTQRALAPGRSSTTTAMVFAAAGGAALVLLLVLLLRPSTPARVEPAPPAPPVVVVPPPSPAPPPPPALPPPPAVDASKARAEEEFREAEKLYAAKSEGALARFNKVLELNPDHGGALHHRGHIHLAAGRVGEATADWKRGLSVEPSSMELHLDLAKACETEKNFAAAKEYLLAAARLHPKQSEPHHRLGHLLHEELHDYVAAEGEFTRAYELEPRSKLRQDRAIVRLAIFCKTDHADAVPIQGALADAEEAVAGSRTYSTLTTRGRCRHEKGDWKGAIEDYEAALALKPPAGTASSLQGLLEKAKAKKRNH
jgi:Tfp pilus assembly protein PilF